MAAASGSRLQPLEFPWSFAAAAHTPAIRRCSTDRAVSISRSPIPPNSVALWVTTLFGTPADAACTARVVPADPLCVCSCQYLEQIGICASV